LAGVVEDDGTVEYVRHEEERLGLARKTDCVVLCEMLRESATRARLLCCLAVVTGEDVGNKADVVARRAEALRATPLAAARRHCKHSMLCM